MSQCHSQPKSWTKEPGPSHHLLFGHGDDVEQTSGPCQQTIMEGIQWSPGLQEAKGVRLVELCSEKDDSHLSGVRPVGKQ